MTDTETASSVSAGQAAAPTRQYSLLAGLLSYLVPGLGQIYQGRVAKGLLFFVALYGMFFYGMHLGQWSNVYLPQPSNRPGGFKFLKIPWLSSVINDRLAFAGQFWIGVAAWPAIYHYRHVPDTPHAGWAFWRDFQREPPEDPPTERDPDYDFWKGRSLNELQQQGDKSWDLGMICTIIAGVLNLLVIYDAFAGPALTGPAKKEGDSA
jgi:hypothetical protein